MENNVVKVKNFIRFYDTNEINSMNFLFGKNDSNNWFTQEELAFASNINLQNKEQVEKARNDWFISNFE